MIATYLLSSESLTDGPGILVNPDMGSWWHASGSWLDYNGRNFGSDSTIGRIHSLSNLALGCVVQQSIRRKRARGRYMYRSKRYASGMGDIADFASKIFHLREVYGDFLLHKVLAYSNRELEYGIREEKKDRKMNRNLMSSPLNRSNSSAVGPVCTPSSNPTATTSTLVLVVVPNTALVGHLSSVICLENYTVLWSFQYLIDSSIRKLHRQ